MSKIMEELALLLAYLSSWEEKAAGKKIRRSWKNYHFSIIDELEKDGFLRGEKGSKSFYFTEKGEAKAVELKQKYSAAGRKTGNKQQKAAEDAYIFEISIRDIEPLIWRKLSLPGSMTLEEFACVIMTVFGWSGGHLHGFRIAGKEYGPVEADPDFSNPIDERKVRIKDFEENQLGKFSMIYDYGDNWEHVIKLKSVPKGEGKYPACLEGRRAGPPEDCGSVPGYYEIIDALHNRKNPTEEQKQKLDWLGSEYDPEFFDIDSINNKIKNTRSLVRRYTLISDL